MTKYNLNSNNTNNINLTGFLMANWNAPANVRTLITTRLFREASSKNHGLNVKGIIEPFGNFNLALHVDDNPQIVADNRAYLAKYLPQEPHWLQQTHSNNILNLDKPNIRINNTNNHATTLSYDASYTATPNNVCAIMTADCLPILITNTSGTAVAAVHAGWRGLVNGIIGNTLNQLTTSNLNINISDILIYIAPCICSQHFIVGNEVYMEFINLNPDNQQFFKSCDVHHSHNKLNHDELHHNAMQHNIKYHCDLIGIARLQLLKSGVIAKNIFTSNECTACNSKLFYSYRTHPVTGRFASIIWLE